MSKPLTFGSVCSGIEAASVAWHPLGWRAAFLSEIEPFPRAVLAHHYPETPLHGDFTTIAAGQYEPIDLLVGGTPCQSFSVAGLRGGLDDDRGNLALEYLRLADRLRPRWLVWENVPGVLSSNGGRDFGAILGGMVELGYGVAYRVLDAQFFGVAQRRRRVFVVGYAGDWRRAAAVLFERHSLSGHPAPRREKGQSAAGVTGGGPENGRLAGNVRSKWAKGTGGPAGDECYNLVAFDTTQVTSAANFSNPKPGDPCHPLASGAHAPAVAYRTAGDGCVYEEGQCTAPLTTGTDSSASIVAWPLNANALRGDTRAKTPSMDAAGFMRLRDPGLGIGDDGDPADTLQAAGPGAVAFALRGRSGGAMPEIEGDGSRAGALRAASGGSSRDYVAFDQYNAALGGDVSATMAKSDGHARVPSLLAGHAVRRLTPRECERLQGFPDDYTLISWRKGVAPDGPRYKALGNSMAVPVMAWIGRRIAQVDAIPHHIHQDQAA